MTEAPVEYLISESDIQAEIVKRHEEAVACFRRAVEIDPRSAIDWANLGSNLRDLGRNDEAIAMYEKALSLDPGIAFARASHAKLTRER